MKKSGNFIKKMINLLFVFFYRLLTLLRLICPLRTISLKAVSKSLYEQNYLFEGNL